MYLHIDSGPRFPFASWLRQAFDSYDFFHIAHTTWPHWSPMPYTGVEPTAGQCQVRRHGFALPHETEGVRESFTADEWYPYISNYSDTIGHRIVTTPSLVEMADGAAYWLMEPAIRSAMIYSSDMELIFPTYVPGPQLAATFALGFGNAWVHLRSNKPHPAPLVSPLPYGAVFETHSDYLWNEGTSQGYIGPSGPPWLVKAASVGLTSRRQSTQVAYLQTATFGNVWLAYDYGAWDWDGTTWTRKPDEAVTGEDENPDLHANGTIAYGVFVNEETGIVEGAQAVPQGASMWLDSASNSTNGQVVGLVWPLSIRGLRATAQRWYSLEYWWEDPIVSIGTGRVVILWRPMGGYALSVVGSSAPSFYQGDLARLGCSLNALSYVNQAAVNGAAEGGWRVLGAFGLTARTTEGVDWVSGDIVMDDPPDPGEEVWVIVRHVLDTTFAGEPFTYVDPAHSKAFLVPGPTVLPHCLPVAGGGAIAGGTL